MSDVLSAACPSCKATNFYTQPQEIRCVSCCYDETVPAVIENIYDAEGNAVDSRIIEPTQVIQHGCTFSVDADGVVARVK